jgi:hypothetical protein
MYNGKLFLFLQLNYWYFSVFSTPVYYFVVSDEYPKTIKTKFCKDLNLMILVTALPFFCETVRQLDVYDIIKLTN